MRRFTPRLLTATMSLALLVGGCGEDVALEPPDETPEPEVGLDETRTIELRFMRFDVDGFEQRLTLEDLQQLPPKTLENIWVLDLELRELTVNAFAQIRDMSDEDAAELPQATQNMRKLLTMTPDNANLKGTNLEELIALSGAIGIPPAKSLANLMGIGVTDEIVPIETAADVFVDLVIATHPNAQFRPGPKDDEHPDGQWPVTPGAIPITMADVAKNFETLSTKFGKVGEHPGFVDVAEGVIVTEEDFALIVRVTAQALPYKGVDLTNVSRASVNSKPGQIDTLFDFDDPDWMQLEGLAKTPLIQDLRHTILENDAFISGGTSQQPTPTGDSQAWSLPTWEFEHIISETAYRWAQTIPPHCDDYELGTGVTVFTACVGDDGWVTMETFNDVGDPPAPAYFWDLQLEIAQTRLHDEGLAEGQADVQAIVQNVEVGITPDELMDQIRDNAKQNPEGLKELARAITNSTVGDADFYYYRTLPDASGAVLGDWLYFIIEDDIRRDEDGELVKSFADYAHVGFFADAALTNKVSDLTEVEGDDEHEKVRVQPGDSYYVGDDKGRVYQIRVGEKPSTYRLSLDVTRVK